MIGIAITGATGSIGDSTLDIIRQHRSNYHVIALTGHSNTSKLIQLAEEFKPQFVVVSDDSKYLEVKNALSASEMEVLSGAEGLQTIVEHKAVDVVVAGIVGSAGMPSVMAAVEAGKTLLLANKESLVMAGELVMQAATENGSRIIPLDSEHNAIYQCLGHGYQAGITPKDVEKIVLTASGGPFWNTPAEEFAGITPEQAVAHPRWDMGAKISVDSATLMNKGLEMIEAHWLFQMPMQQIEAVVHPQSAVHSLVHFRDSSVLAQMGDADMRIPIAYGLGMANAQPQRMTSGAADFDVLSLGRLEFYPPDTQKFPCLQLAVDAAETGGTAPTVLNAVNEVSVAAFLQKRIRFDQIAAINDKLLSEMTYEKVESLQQLVAIDSYARQKAQQHIEYYG
ncbi:1-deoxy-D-xylulose-5-phosphate reductoisomerase [Marinicella sp. W31]|uniref:1-deoxy-D-xylulose-5-phosphate reductoisomerase n=1 Tax=Marinicella sp. W31 TaxID=3023713 RepID=UPI003757BD13